MPYQHYLEGQWVTGDGASLTVTNPTTEATVADLTLADEAQLLSALQCAHQAQSSWRKLTSAARARHLQQLAQAIETAAPSIGAALAEESGKSLADATAEAQYAGDITRYHAEWARRIEGELMPSDNPDEQLMLMREPLGVAVCLIPFNFPIFTLMRKLAPALITGNTVIARLSNHTPLSGLVLAEAIEKAGLPPGVIQVAVTDHASCETLCRQPEVGIISLTGSVEAGRQVLGYSQSHITKVSLELGGKTPAIVADDADIKQASQAIVGSRMTHCGQLCTAVERVYAQAAIYPQLVAQLKADLESLNMGSRLDNPQAIGPLISRDAQQRIHAKVQAAVQAGAHCETGGYLPDGEGYFYPPTLLTQISNDMDIIQTETFAPVLCVMPYDDLDEALRLANDSPYGLASVFYSNRYQDVMRVANEIEAGELYINSTPADPYQGFHAGWKHSGLGGDDGKHGMLEFTQTRMVALNFA